ncbi:hypothetical protein [Yoonia vestfoldensis]|uniref:hypothetical protein n=1 Tax=Yoonia vestfoldensis TaxID=245188 RepID=UPI0012FF9A96|nr:hypothetical protein [Yoonia vestfoldensis]
MLKFVPDDSDDAVNLGVNQVKFTTFGGLRITNNAPAQDHPPAWFLLGFIRICGLSA